MEMPRPSFLAHIFTNSLGSCYTVHMSEETHKKKNPLLETVSQEELDKIEVPTKEKIREALRKAFEEVRELQWNRHPRFPRY